MTNRFAIALMAANLGVVALLVFAWVAPAATGFRAEALELRTVVYAVGLAIVPAVWFMTGRPDDLLVADAFLLIPFVFDALGNSLGLYARIDNFDNYAHLVGTFALTVSAGVILARRRCDRLTLALAAVGVAAILSTGIELVEWVAYSHPVRTGFNAYRDTIGDLFMNVVGCALGALVLVLLLAVRSEPR